MHVNVHQLIINIYVKYADWISVRHHEFSVGIYYGFLNQETSDNTAVYEAVYVLLC